eukprot:TRINITY_DN5732_c0_g1_i4.p2 TRINITY_DN5732_c0_g1~~TRINITY_DN5732_c0_g1_i4.p2  ORF type:complete len:128 (-),score=3.08 TRINITY_DN5732_c0_g1_i4:292-675(-)
MEQPTVSVSFRLVLLCSYWWFQTAFLQKMMKQIILITYKYASTLETQGGVNVYFCELFCKSEPTFYVGGIRSKIHTQISIVNNGFMFGLYAVSLFFVLSVWFVYLFIIFLGGFYVEEVVSNMFIVEQ